MSSACAVPSVPLIGMFEVAFTFVDELTAHQAHHQRLFGKWNIFWANRLELLKWVVVFQIASANAQLTSLLAAEPQRGKELCSQMKECKRWPGTVALLPAMICLLLALQWGHGQDDDELSASEPEEFDEYLSAGGEHNGPQDEHGVTHITWARGPDSTWFTRPSSCSLQSRTARDSVAPYWRAGKQQIRLEIEPYHRLVRRIWPSCEHIHLHPASPW
jgi:hypothetical protein